MNKVQRPDLPQHGLSSQEVDWLWYLFHFIPASGWISAKEKKNPVAILEGARKYLDHEISGAYAVPHYYKLIDLLNSPNVKLESLVKDVYLSQKTRLRVRVEAY
jgi:hypothetical protein